MLRRQKRSSRRVIRAGAVSPDPARTARGSLPERRKRLRRAFAPQSPRRGARRFHGVRRISARRRAPFPRGNLRQGLAEARPVSELESERRRPLAGPVGQFDPPRGCRAIRRLPGHRPVSNVVGAESSTYARNPLGGSRFATRGIRRCEADRAMRVHFHHPGCPVAAAPRAARRDLPGTVQAENEMLIASQGKISIRRSFRSGSNGPPGCVPSMGLPESSKLPVMNGDESIGKIKQFQAVYLRCSIAFEIWTTCQTHRCRVFRQPRLDATEPQSCRQGRRRRETRNRLHRMRTNQDIS